MRKVVISIVALLAVLTFLALGLNATQQDLIPIYLNEMIK